MTDEWRTGAGSRGGHREVVAHDGAERADDWRVYHVEKMDLEALDKRLDEAHDRWVRTYQDLEEAKLWVWEMENKIDDLEKALLAGMDEEIVQATLGQRSSKTERDERRHAIMEQDTRWQAAQAERSAAESARRKAEVAHTVVEEERKHIRAKIGWRQAVVGFWRTVHRVPLVHAPDHDGVVSRPAQPVQDTGAPVSQETGQAWRVGTGSIHDLPMTYDAHATENWLRAMEQNIVRHSPGGKLALQVLPAGVDPNDPRVIAVRDDIRRYFADEEGGQRKL